MGFGETVEGNGAVEHAGEGGKGGALSVGGVDESFVDFVGEDDDLGVLLENSGDFGEEFGGVDSAGGVGWVA